MIKIVSIFFFILSILFITRHIVEFVMALRDENPKPIEINKISEALIYLSVAYVITFLITI